MAQPRRTSRQSAAASAPPGKTPKVLHPAAARPQAPRKHDEDDLQKAVCAFLDRAVRRPDRYWAVPNGGKRDKREAQRMTALGVKPGVLDLHFAWAFGAVRQFPAFGVIELKAGKNTMTPDQEAFAKDMAALGWPWAECRTLEEVERALREWGFPLHATVLPSGVTYRKVTRA